MKDQEVPDEMLMALADGELPELESQRLRRRIERDPALAQRFALFAETRALLSPASPSAGAAVDDRAAARIRALAVRVDHDAARRMLSPARRSARWMLPLAASIALALGVFAGHVATRMAGQSAEVAAVLSLPVPAEILRAALDATPSEERVTWTTSGGGTLAMLATHRVASGGVCREFDVVANARPATAVLAVACRAGDRWEPRFAIARAIAGDAFTPASGPDGAAERYLADLGSTGAIDRDAERAMMRAGWR